MLNLTVLQGPDKGRKFELPNHEPQLIGRSSEALPISDNTVSRRHAELTPDDGIWWIRDLESQNGTYVNGIRITDRTRLRSGDQIRVGSSLFVFGQTEGDVPDVLRLLKPDQMEAEVERTLPSNDDSMILAEPEPGRAAIDHLRIIYKLTTLTTHTMDRQRLLAAVMDLVFNEFRPERGFIVLMDDMDTKSLKPIVVKYKTAPKHKDEARIHVSRTIVQHAIAK
ncbi:MAG: FHA domain-containing protein, partial [Phycisphaerales bacterium]|nr:FHA domain-containing protein [Phycisphaerales bacterium]